MKKILLITFYLLLFTPIALAVPSQMNYQGVLKNSSGALVSSEVSMKFAIYAAATGGGALWSETQSIVTVEAGLYSVQLGSATALSHSFFDGSTRYLGVAVPSGGTELTPRIPLITVPYAFRAGTAESVGGIDASGLVQLGPSSMQTTSAAIGADISSTNVAGVGIRATAEGFGVIGIASSALSYGVWGSGLTAGVYGIGTTGDGVQGISTSGDGVYGSSTSGFAVNGIAPGVNGRGIFGRATHTTGNNFGVIGISSSTGGYGVSAQNTAASNQVSHAGAALKITGMIIADSGDGYCFGDGTIANASDTVTVANKACDTTSLVLASLIENPGAAISIRDITPLAGSFVVTLTNLTGNSTDFRYLIIN